MVQRGLSGADGAASARNERRDPSGSRLCRIPGSHSGFEGPTGLPATPTGGCGAAAHDISPGHASIHAHGTTKFAQHATNHRFWAFFRTLGKLLRAQDPTRRDFETYDTSAATDAGQHETPITTAHP